MKTLFKMRSVLAIVVAAITLSACEKEAPFVPPYALDSTVKLQKGALVFTSKNTVCSDLDWNFRASYAQNVIATNEQIEVKIVQYVSCYGGSQLYALVSFTGMVQARYPTIVNSSMSFSNGNPSYVMIKVSDLLP